MNKTAGILKRLAFNMELSALLVFCLLVKPNVALTTPGNTVTVGAGNTTAITQGSKSNSAQGNATTTTPAYTAASNENVTTNIQKVITTVTQRNMVTTPAGKITPILRGNTTRTVQGNATSTIQTRTTTTIQPRTTTTNQPNRTATGQENMTTSTQYDNNTTPAKSTTPILPGTITATTKGNKLTSKLYFNATTELIPPPATQRTSTTTETSILTPSVGSTKNTKKISSFSVSSTKLTTSSPMTTSMKSTMTATPFPKNTNQTIFTASTMTHPSSTMNATNKISAFTSTSIQPNNTTAAKTAKNVNITTPNASIDTDPETEETEETEEVQTPTSLQHISSKSPKKTTPLDILAEEKERLKTRPTIPINAGVKTIDPIITDPNAVVPHLPELVFAAYGDVESNLPSTGKSKELTVGATYAGCGRKKRCIGFPLGCVPYRTCLSLIAYAEEGDRVNFQIMGQSGKYVAIGLSDDQLMGNDSVIECVREADNAVRGYMSWNEGHSNKRETDQSAITNVRGFYADGHVMCELYRKRITYAHNQVFDLGTGTFYILLALGNSGTESNIGYHDDGHSSTSSKYYLNDQYSKLLTRVAFENTHSALNIIAWLFFLPVSIFVARYFKECYTSRACCFDFTVWFTVHIVLAGFAVLLSLIGIGLAYTPDPTAGAKIRTRWPFHARIGIACACILLFECITGILIVFLNLKTRNQILNYVHGLVGHISMFVAIALMFETTKFGNGLPCKGKDFLIAYIVVFLIFVLIMAYQLCFADFLLGYHISRAFNIFHVRPIHHLPGEETSGSGLRKIFLGFFITFALFMTLLLLFLYFYFDSCSEGEPE